MNKRYINIKIYLITIIIFKWYIKQMAAISSNKLNINGLNTNNSGKSTNSSSPDRPKNIKTTISSINNNILANKFDLLKKNIQNSDKMLFFLNYLDDNESSFKVVIRLCEH